MERQKEITVQSNYECIKIVIPIIKLKILHQLKHTLKECIDLSKHVVHDLRLPRYTILFGLLLNDSRGRVKEIPLEHVCLQAESTI